MMLPQGAGTMAKESFFGGSSGSIMSPAHNAYVQQPAYYANAVMEPFGASSYQHDLPNNHHVQPQVMQSHMPSAHHLIQNIPQSYNNHPNHMIAMSTPSPFYSYEHTPTPMEAHYPTAHVPTTAMDTCQQISQVLLCYQQGGEDSAFVRKAIESLVKKLKDKRGELDSLITAVTSNGKQATGCVTIQKSLDGRLQVAGRKGVPHVVYTRIWRWPNINKHELVKMSACTTNEHQDCICINPYHYEQIVSNSISTMNASTGSNKYYSGHTYPDQDNHQNLHQVAEPQTMYNIPNQISHDLEVSEDDFPSINERDVSRLLDNAGPVQGYSSGHWTSPSTSSQHMLTDNPEHMLSDIRHDFGNENLTIPIAITSNPLEFWCTITYYEFDTPVGCLKVRFDKQEITIDGGMDPHSEINGRFCLGALFNVHRTGQSDNVRMNIGGGVKLRTNPDGQVIMEFHSSKSVFVRSGYLDYRADVPDESKVHKFPAQSEPVIIFDLNWAYREMKSRILCAEKASRARTAAVAGVFTNQKVPNFTNMTDYSSVDCMRRSFCTLEFSFVKGWGTGYNKRTVKDTPCWIEIQLHRSLQILDYVLKNSGTL